MLNAKKHPLPGQNTQQPPHIFIQQLDISKITEAHLMHKKLLRLLNMDLFFILAYTQVATLSVFAYLFFSMFAHQYLEPSSQKLDTDTFSTIKVAFSDSDTFLRHTPDIYFPVFAILEFVCYMGWIKVAETLINPWGDDDEYFQINYLIDRNFKVT